MPSKDWQDCQVENLLKKQEEQEARVKHLDVVLSATVESSSKDEYIYLAYVYGDDIRDNLSMAEMFISKAPLSWLTEVFAAFPSKAKEDSINANLVMDRFANNATTPHNPKVKHESSSNLDSPTAWRV